MQTPSPRPSNTSRRWLQRLGGLFFQRLRWPSRFQLFYFQRFQSRLLAIILLLVIVLQALVFFTISNAANGNAMRASFDALQLTASSLQTTLSARESNLRKTARVLSSDFAFKSLVSEGDHETMLSAFSSYQKRMDADWMLVLDLEGKVLADSKNPSAEKILFPHPTLIDAARSNPDAESSGILFVGGLAYQVVLVPLQAPEQIAWVGVGFAITDRLATELEQQTHTHVSLVWQSPQKSPLILASTLNAAQRLDLVMASVKEKLSAPLLQLANADFVSKTVPLNRDGDGVLTAVLQRSLDDALASFHALRWRLLAVFILSTIIAAIAAIIIARRVTRPMARLALAARSISGGHYEMIGDIGQKDEFGALANAFDNMVRGLLERDQVRSLLGKVVSHQVAEELLSRKIELGGEEREISILFSDIRGFTSLSEGRAPSAILAMLNTYLSRMSDVVDQHHGVVDKYIGDAVMALFGAPVLEADDAQRAVDTALAMEAAMPLLNQAFAQEGWPPLQIGIGIHTGNAVVGNVGSETRLNYTVLGDNVNLAARLESLCKRYQVGIIVSEVSQSRCPHITFRELDRVRVKGKREAVSIYQALGHNDAMSASQKELLVQHELALAAYRRGEFMQAQKAFVALPEDAVSLLYRARCAKFLKHPPATDWDAIENLEEK